MTNLKCWFMSTSMSFHLHISAAQILPPLVTELKSDKVLKEDSLPMNIFRHHYIISLHVYEVLNLSHKTGVMWFSFPFSRKMIDTCVATADTSLIYITSKVVMFILLRRFQLECDCRTPPNQCSFWPGTGCTDQIFT